MRQGAWRWQNGPKRCQARRLGLRWVIVMYVYPYPYPWVMYPYPYPKWNPWIPVPIPHGYGYTRVWVRIAIFLPMGYPCPTLALIAPLSTIFKYSSVNHLQKKKHTQYLNREGQPHLFPQFSTQLSFAFTFPTSSYFACGLAPCC